ncbi:unnamed protein product [Soboliphyme baturini]|uniref:E3 ubiquitin-protein ligase n=1 Tax=Soboliphyme baturini TaxID=241478 RepID=A0A183IHG1_9BILA|nr:unnamed protein product [Soboliphyme baturini]
MDVNDQSGGAWRETAGTIKELCHARKSAEANGDVAGVAAIDKDLKSWMKKTLTMPLFKPDYSGILWCKYLIAGGECPEEYFEKITHYDSSVCCGLVWNPSFIAYRCRTCGLSPGTSICPSCFNAANHEGHDFNMFKSQDGGACDCGDVTVMKEIGFCPRHGPKSSAEKKFAPPDLFYTAEILFPALLSKLLFVFREFYGIDKGITDARLGFKRPFDQLVDFLQELSNHGSTMKKLLAVSLTDLQVYQSATALPPANHEDYDRMNDAQSAYMKSLIDVRSIYNVRDVTSFGSDCPELLTKLQHESLLDEIIFWLIPGQYPQNVVVFLLSLLSDEDFKNKFSVSFVKHYSYMALALTKGGGSQSVSNRVLHITVQLFSSDVAACRLVEKHNLLRTLMFSLMSMIKMCLIDSRLNNEERNFHLVVDCSSNVMVNHNYWPLISDLQCLISHERVALHFLRDPILLHLWCHIIMACQGMNPNYRQLQRHVEFESRGFLHAFTAEIELFQTLELLSFSPAICATSPLRPEWASAMIEGALRLLATLVTNTVNLGSGDYENTKLELATLLSTESKTYSELYSQMPDKGVFTRQLDNFDQALAELADYSPPTVKITNSMTEGTYAPKDIVWEKLYDSLHVIMRSSHSSFYHTSMDHYADYVRKRTGKQNVLTSQLWPPMRIPSNILDVYHGLRDILHCKCLHAIIYVILYKVMRLRL